MEQQITELTIPATFQIGVDLPFPLNGKATSGVRLQFESLTPDLCEITATNICKIKGAGTAKIKVTAPAYNDHVEQVSEIDIDCTEADFTTSAAAYVNTEKQLYADIGILDQLSPLGLNEISSILINLKGQANVSLKTVDQNEIGGNINLSKLNEHVLNRMLLSAQDYIQAILEDQAAKKQRIKTL